MVMVKSNFCVGVERLPFKPEGYNFWTWRGHRIHYVVQGEGSPIVLIHGFGASAFHWRLVLSLLWTPTVPHSVNPCQILATLCSGMSLPPSFWTLLWSMCVLVCVSGRWEIEHYGL